MDRMDEVYNHVLSEGFGENYDVWIFHGEDHSSLNYAIDLDDDSPKLHDNIDGLLHDSFRDILEATSGVQQGPNEEAKEFYRLLEEAYEKERLKDGNLRQPADGKAWKEFDALYPIFGKEPGNVRLGLASDGFNPFRTMSISHSTWYVVLVNYNLPPWVCMKPEYFNLSLLIPGPESPGNNIDMYLQPLIDELNELRNDSLETYDKFKNETFKMYAALTWTISDFPVYSMLSGWKIKGKFAVLVVIIVRVRYT